MIPTTRRAARGQRLGVATASQRRIRLRRLLASTCCGLPLSVLLAACAASDRTGSLSARWDAPATAPAPSVADGGLAVRPLTTSTTRELVPGRYARDGFRPALSFEVTGRWYAIQDVPGFFDVEREAGTPDVIAVQFTRPVGLATVAEVVDALRARSDLVAGTPQPVLIGGRRGTRIVVETTDPDLAAARFVPVLRVPAGPISIASGRRLQVDLLDTDDGVLAVLVGGSVRAWDAAWDAATPVLESIRFGS